MATDPIAAQSGASAAPQDNAIAQLSSDYTMFLRLLTTQMQIQDPLDPLDTSQYTQQLVQYSQVEQSIQQTKALKDILARLSAQDMVQASSLIGREASYADPVAGLSAAVPARWQWRLDGQPASLIATISDASGQVVDTRILTPDTRSLSWDGLLATGALAQPGLYSLSLDARDTSGNTMTSETESLGIVQSVSQQDGVLNFTVGGVPVTADALRNIALPPSGN